MNSTKTYFHTFDALRFFSFLIVFFHHSPFEKPAVVEFFTKSGGIGVLFFFVLSGFLITYLLLFEKNRKGAISFKNFFIRRILRIWPLFYAMILFAFYTPYILKFLKLGFSGTGYEPNWLMSALFLENYKMMIEGQFANVSPLPVMWSLCIEEHFYLIWGLLIYIIPCRKVPFLLFISIIMASLFRIFYFIKGWPYLDLFTNLDFFAFGGLVAWSLIFKKNIFLWVEKISLPVKYLFIYAILVLVIVSPHFGGGMTDLILFPVLAFSFSLIIVFTLSEKNAVYINDNNIFSRLGVFTYGLYLIHTIVINLVIRLKPMLPFQLNWFTGGLLSLVLTILFSIACYHLFEKQFLKLKKYFY